MITHDMYNPEISYVSMTIPEIGLKLSNEMVRTESVKSFIANIKTSSILNFLNRKFNMRKGNFRFKDVPVEKLRAIDSLETTITNLYAVKNTYKTVLEIVINRAIPQLHTLTPSESSCFHKNYVSELNSFEKFINDQLSDLNSRQSASNTK